MPLSLKTIKSAVQKAAAFRRIQRLQPVGGVGDTIFPPTYPLDERKDNSQQKGSSQRKSRPQRHVFERRHRAGANGASTESGREVVCVLIDSVQSQANRLEDALLEMAGEGLPLPYATVDFTHAGLEPPDAPSLRSMRPPGV